MSQNSNIFSVFYYQTSWKEKQLIINLCLLFAFCSSAFIGIPIWFAEPKLLCKNPQNNSYYDCLEEEMCSKNLSFIINPEGSPDTLISKLDLFCERKYIKRVLLTVVYFGGFIGSVVNFLVYIGPRIRQKILSLLGIVFAISNFCIVFFGYSELIIGASLALISFTSIIANAHGFIIINEYFSGSIAQAATIFMRLFWGTFGICFGAFCYLINSNWRILFFTMGFLVLLVSLCLFFSKNEKGCKETSGKAPTNVLQFFKELYGLEKIRTNFCVYVYLWTASSITYNAIWLELETLGGNFYLNMMLVSTLEILASFLASYVVSKLNLMDVLGKLLVALAILFGLFIFSPVSLQNIDSPIKSTCFLILMLFGKLFSEVVANLSYVHAPKVLTDKFTPSFMITVRLFSRICLLFLPYINYYLYLLHLHAYILVAIVWISVRFFYSFAKEIQPEGIEDLLKEFKIGLVSRMSIMSGASHACHDPDDLIKNLEVEGVSLKDIKNSNSRTIHQSLLGDHKKIMGDIYSKDDLD